MALAFLLIPSLPSQLLFGEAPRAALTVMLGRLLGAAVLSLAIVCWWASFDAENPLAYSVIKAMLFYNFTAGALLVSARFWLGLSGVLLWPGVAAHAVLGGWCIMAVKRR